MATVYLRFFGVVVDAEECDASDCEELFLLPASGNAKQYCSSACRQREYARRTPPRVRRPRSEYPRA